MSKVTPSQVVSAIEMMFTTNERLSSEGRTAHFKQKEVRALLDLLDDLPSELIILPFAEYLEFKQQRASLATALPGWNLGATQPAYGVGGKNAVEALRLLLKKCPDEPPPPESELPFITDDEVRLSIEKRIRAAWTDFRASEWFGATIIAANALESVLLWEVKRAIAAGAKLPPKKKPPDEMALAELIGAASDLGSIHDGTAKQAQLARDARNLVHPGKVAASGSDCDMATALAAFAAVYRVAGDLRGKASTAQTTGPR